MNSFRMSFWMVPVSLACGTPCSSPATMKLAGVDRHACLADVADDARVVAVVAAVGGEVEGHRQAHLPGGEVGPVEGVGLLGGGESGVLPDGPRLRGVHRGAWPAQEREVPRHGVEKVEALDVGARVERIQCEAFGGVPDQIAGIGAFPLLARQLLPAAPVRPVRRIGHDREIYPFGPRVQRPRRRVRSTGLRDGAGLA
jgi:hypothetical protein